MVDVFQPEKRQCAETRHSRHGSSSLKHQVCEPAATPSPKSTRAPSSVAIGKRRALRTSAFVTGHCVPNVAASRLLPYEKAHATGRWAEIIFRAVSTRVAKRWRFVSFRGAHRSEWRGVVDVLAIRKNTSQPQYSSLKRGDLFDIVLVQMKGGSARRPSIQERRRLREVARHYGAQDVVLFQWRRGESSEFFKLGRDLEWKLTTCTEVFG